MCKNGDHVVVDNVPFHCGAASPVPENWLGRQGTGLVYTPYYSPVFNAAEHVFSYLKIMLKNNNICQKGTLELTSYSLWPSRQPYSSAHTRFRKQIRLPHALATSKNALEENI